LGIIISLFATMRYKQLNISGLRLFFVTYGLKFYAEALLKYMEKLRSFQEPEREVD
jgi:hypothetical protein